MATIFSDSLHNSLAGAELAKKSIEISMIKSDGTARTLNDPTLDPKKVFLKFLENKIKFLLIIYAILYNTCKIDTISYWKKIILV